MLSNRTIQPPLIRKLTLADLTRIVQLQQAVTAELPPGYIFPKTESDLGTYLDGTLGVAYGVFEKDALAASSLLRIPSKTHPNDTSMPFPLVPAEEWALHAGGLGNTLVLPAARGRGYQRALIDARISHAAAAQMRWICAGVHIGNSASWINLLSKGMAIVGMRTDFGYPLIGLLRNATGVPFALDADDCVVVPAYDAAQHQAALQDGYVGVRITSNRTVRYYRSASPGAGPVVIVSSAPARVEGRASRMTSA